MISIGTDLGKACSSFGSAAETADTQTAVPRTRASKNVRILEAMRLFIFSLEEIRKKTLEPYLLWCGHIRPEERGQDVFQPFRIDATDHSPRMRDGYRTALFRHDHGYRVTHFTNAKSRAVSESHLPFGRAIEDAAC